MSTISYSSTHQNEVSATGTFLYTSESIYGEDWHSFPHRHFCSEIFLINSGSGQFQVESAIFPVEKNDVIIVNSSLQHTEYSTKGNPLNYYVVGVEDINFVFNGTTNGYGVINDKELSKAFGQTMLYMLNEMKGQREHHNTICKKMSDILVCLLLRQDAIQELKIAQQSVTKECLIAKEYIDQNFASEINLDILAEHSHFSKFHLSRKFNEEFGLSPMRYLAEKRLQVAEQLLSYTNLTIAQVADSAGYSSQSYFSQVYRKYKRTSPAEYRKSKMFNEKG